MPLESDGPPRDLQILRRKQNDTNTMLAIIMAGIAGLFILGIVAVYNYGANDSVASVPASTTSASAPSATTGANRPSETTGSGNTSEPVPQKPDHSQKQR